MYAFKTNSMDMFSVALEFAYCWRLSAMKVNKNRITIEYCVNLSLSS